MLSGCPTLSALGLALASGSWSYQPWLYLLLSLACSAGWLLSSRQDVGFRAIAGAVLGQLLALFFLIGMIVKALLSHWWTQAVISAAALSLEIWLVNRWYFRREPK